MSSPTDPYARLDEIYAEIPDVGCKGLCHDSCHSVGATVLERARVAERGVQLPEMGAFPDGCPALTMFKRCGVYEARPTICRLWAATESMPCPYGCRPAAGRMLTDPEAADLLRRVSQVSASVLERRTPDRRLGKRAVGRPGRRRR